MNTRTFPQLVVVLITLLTLSGCEFFGKKSDDVTDRPVGQLNTGQNIIGTWTTNYAGTADNRNPTSAYQETYIFEPNGSAKVELKDPHSSGIDCVGFGQYRIEGTDVLIFIQATNNNLCGFGYPIHLSQVDVNGQSLTYTDPTNQGRYTYFKDQNVGALAPVGLWDFNGAGADQNGDGGFDWILMNPYGYFVLQTRFSGEMYLLIGYYKLTDTGGIEFVFFDSDPSQPVGATMFYESYFTNSTSFSLVTDGNDTIYTGTKL